MDFVEDGVDLGFWQYYFHDGEKNIKFYQTKQYQPNQAKPNQTRLRRVVAPIFILRSIVTLKNCVYLNSSILMLPEPKYRVPVEDPQLIWWISTAYMCEQSFSYQTQLRLSQVWLCWGWSWVGVLTILFSWLSKKHEILPNQTIPT